MTDLPGNQPIPYTVNFPDGRVETFTADKLDGAGYWHTAPGVSERFQPLSNGLCYLLLADGGKVEFHADQTSWTDYESIPHVTYYSYHFVAQAMIVLLSAGAFWGRGLLH